MCVAVERVFAVVERRDARSWSYFMGQASVLRNSGTDVADLDERSGTIRVVGKGRRSGWSYSAKAKRARCVPED